MLRRARSFKPVCGGGSSHDLRVQVGIELIQYGLLPNTIAMTRELARYRENCSPYVPSKGSHIPRGGDSEQGSIGASHNIQAYKAVAMSYWIEVFISGSAPNQGPWHL